LENARVLRDSSYNTLVWAPQRPTSSSETKQIEMLTWKLCAAAGSSGFLSGCTFLAYNIPTRPRTHSTFRIRIAIPCLSTLLLFYTNLNGSPRRTRGRFSRKSVATARFLCSPEKRFLLHNFHRHSEKKEMKTDRYDDYAYYTLM
jgi:hypothetical protein